MGNDRAAGANERSIADLHFTGERRSRTDVSGSANDAVVVDVRIGVDDCEFADAALDVHEGAGHDHNTGANSSPRGDDGARSADSWQLESFGDERSTNAVAQAVRAESAKSMLDPFRANVVQLFVRPDDRNPGTLPRRSVGIGAAHDVPTCKAQAIDYDLGMPACSNNNDRTAVACLRHCSAEESGAEAAQMVIARLELGILDQRGFILLGSLHLAARHLGAIARKEDRFGIVRFEFQSAFVRRFRCIEQFALTKDMAELVPQPPGFPFNERCIE